MVTSPRSGAAALADQAQQRRHPAPSMGDQLQRASADLDLLIRDVHAGLGSARGYDDCEERAHAIAAGVVAAFRRPARPVAPCLARTRTGAWF